MFPFVVAAGVTVSKGLEKRAEDLEIWERIEEANKITTLVKSSRIFL